MPIKAEQRWVSVTQLAQRLGISLAEVYLIRAVDSDMPRPKSIPYTTLKRYDLVEIKRWERSFHNASLEFGHKKTG